MFVFHHDAAIKAIEFCPWSKSILATGGGTKDKTIKFWHIGTGTLINQIKTNYQITSLVWSNNRREILATFGFNSNATGLNNNNSNNNNNNRMDKNGNLLLQVYNYPQCKPVLNVTSLQSLRVLNCCLSPDKTSICLTTTDETIRFYKIWDQKSDSIIEFNDSKNFGSDIIALLEGISLYNKDVR